MARLHPPADTQAPRACKLSCELVCLTNDKNAGDDITVLTQVRDPSPSTPHPAG